MLKKRKVLIASTMAVVLILGIYLFTGTALPERYIEQDGYKISIRMRQSPIVQHTAMKVEEDGETTELKIMSTPYYVAARTQNPEQHTVSKWYVGRTYVEVKFYTLGEDGSKTLQHTQQIALEKASGRYVSSIDWYMFE